MKYLVVASGGPGFAYPEEALEVLQSVILPSFKEILSLEKRKKIIAGGLPVGERTFVFIAEAKSNDELDQMLRKIPSEKAKPEDIKTDPDNSSTSPVAVEKKEVKPEKDPLDAIPSKPPVPGKGPEDKAEGVQRE